MSNLNEKWSVFQFRTDAQKRIRTWRKIGGMIDNGIPILAAIEELQKRAKTKGASHPDVLMYADWVVVLKNGERFSVAIEKWIPKSEAMIIAAGEQSGDLIGALNSAITLTLAGKEIRGAVIGGVTYPGILFGLAMGLMWLFGTEVIPKFSKMAGDESKWTGLAQTAVQLSHFTQDYLIWVVIGTGAFVALVIYSLPRWDGPLRIKADSFPPYSIYRLTAGASWLISLAALIKAGVKLEVALQKLSHSSGKWMRNRIAASLAGMRSGLQLGEALAQTGYNFPDEEIIDDLQIYAKLAGFDEALSILGKEWIEEGVARIKKQMGVLKSIAILFVAVVIAVEAGGMFAMQSQLQTIMRH